MPDTRKALPPILITLALVLVATVAFGIEEPGDAREPTDKELAAAALLPPVIPAKAKQVENPFAWNADVRKKGKLYFSSQCTMCHGDEGRGTGDLVERLQLKMPDFTSAEMQSEWTDGAMFYLINKGHGAMPAQKERFDDEIKWGLVNYVRSFASGE